jgi:small subunit ribosomal protein S18
VNAAAPSHHPPNRDSSSQRLVQLLVCLPTLYPARQQKTNTSEESLQSTRTATASRQPQHQVPSTAPAVAPVPPKDAFDVVRKAVGSVEQSDNRLKMDEQARTIARGVDRKGLEMQQIRRWNVGDVYAPHDLSGAEQSKWKRMKQSPRPKWDVLDQLNLNPMDHYKVSSC